jgi:Protein of unknown function (DUF2971)
MNTTFDTSLKNALWADNIEDPSFMRAKPLLAHYTSLEVFEKIIIGNEIWFSNPLYMNDWNELQYGMNLGAHTFRTHSAIINAFGNDYVRHAKLVDLFDALFDNFTYKHAINVYVLCFTEHCKNDVDGKLSMWRAYGSNGGGIAMVFDTANIAEISSSPFVLRKVKYGTKDQWRDWVDAKAISLAKVIEEHERTDANLMAIVWGWMEWLKEFSLFTKHIGFEEEQEWRVVYFSERDKANALTEMCTHAISNKGIQPKLKLKIASVPGVINDAISIDGLTDRIILGPSNSTFFAADTLRRMLERRRPELANRVHASAIPYRP